MVVDVRASATARGAGDPASCVAPEVRLRDDAPASATTARRRWWAHQDANLEQAGYEPAALTVELWAPIQFAVGHLPATRLRGPSFEKRAKLAAARRMAELAERLSLHLPDAFARDREALADLFKGVLAAVADSEPHLDDLFLARRQRLEDRFGLLLGVQVYHRLGRRHHLPILDEVAKMRIFLFADRRFEGDRLLRDLEHLADLRYRNVHPLGD